MDVPLVVFVNTKSGGQQGIKILDKMKKCIPPENVFDLAREGPLPGLQKYGGQRYRIIVCGGDGSVGWILTEIEKLKLAKELTPPVAVLPIGTGNDLSRILKWGGSHKGTKLKSFISKIEKACVVFMDKWEVKYSGEVPLPHERHIMHNYFSVGADASIALQFHEMRLAHPEKFSSRAQNLTWYVRLGLQNFSSDLLQSHVTVEINGNKVALPENTRCVVVLNLPSYSGGGNPWGPKSSKRKSYVSPAIDDGLLEVVAMNGPLQLVGVHANIIRGKRLGQGNQVKLTMAKALPAQVDGEPWSQPPSVINIQFSGKSHVLANSLPNPSTNSNSNSASGIPAHTLMRQPSAYGINRTVSRSLVRTRSSSVPIVHTPSPIKYGPIATAKRKKGRLYCEGCGLEFYLPYMLINHMNSGFCVGGSTSTQTEHAVKIPSTPPGTISVQLGDGACGTDATSSHDSDDDDGGLWRTQSAGIRLQHRNRTDSPEKAWNNAVEQDPVAPSQQNGPENLTLLPSSPALIPSLSPKSIPDHTPLLMAQAPEPVQEPLHKEPAQVQMEHKQQEHKQHEQQEPAHETPIPTHNQPAHQKTLTQQTEVTHIEEGEKTHQPVHADSQHFTPAQEEGNTEI